MSELPFFPLYASDVEAETSHLSLEEDGAFNRLLRIMWITPGFSIPHDRQWIRRRMRVDDETYDRVIAPIIAEFMTIKKGRVIHAKLQERAEELSNKHARLSAAGRKGGLKRGSSQATDKKQKDPKPGSSNTAKPGSSNQNHIQNHKKETTDVVSKKGTRLSSDWVLPKSWGEWASNAGLAENEVRDQADRFRDYWLSVPGQKGVKLDWEATWRNWVRRCAEQKQKPASGKGIIKTIYTDRFREQQAEQEQRVRDFMAQKWKEG